MFRNRRQTAVVLHCRHSDADANNITYPLLHCNPSAGNRFAPRRGKSVWTNPVFNAILPSDQYRETQL